MNLEELEKEFYEISGGFMGPNVEVRSLIEEIVLESLLEERGLIPVAPKPIQDILQNEEYIRDVLGIAIPLNESYPYSLDLQEKILEEQLMMEGWFDGFKKLGTDAKNLALAIRYMFQDSSRIKTFVGDAYNNIIKKPLDTILGFIKKMVAAVSDLFKKFVMPKIQKAWDKIKEFLGWVSEKLEGTWEKIKGMSGWKQALLVIAFGTGIGYIWKEKGVGDIVEKLAGYVDDIGVISKKYGKKLADMLKRSKGPINLAKAGGKVKKAIKKEHADLSSPALAAILLEDDDKALNEFLGKIFGKKNKDAAELGLELPAGEKAPTDGILISPDQAKKAGIEGKNEEEADEEKDGEGGGEGEEAEKEELNIIAELKDEIMAVLEPLINTIKEKFVVIFKEGMKTLGYDALLGLATGGVGAFLKGVKKVWGGMKMISNLFGETLGQFVKKIKDPEEEAEEAEKGEDDPTDPSTKKEESISYDEELLREFVREKLLAAS